MLIHSLIVTLHTSPVFYAIIDAFCSIGKYCVKKSGKTAMDLFFNYSLDKLAPLIISNPQKRGGILMILYSFSPLDTASHIRCIKQLQAIVLNIPNLIYCLGVLSALETQMDEMLLDLYMYYSSIGIASQNPKLRSVSVYILSVLLPMPGAPLVDLILAMLPELTRLSEEETFWESQAHLLVLCAGLFRSFGGVRNNSSSALLSAPTSLDEGYQESPATDERETILDAAVKIVKTLFSPKNSKKNVKLVGLVALAPVISVSTDLISTYIAVLSSISNPDREALLMPSGVGFNIDSSVGSPFLVDTLLNKWDAECIANALEQHVSSSNLERLSLPHLQILMGAVGSMCRDRQIGVDALSSFWNEIFTSLNRYVYIELCNPESCRFSSHIISQYVLYSKEWKNDILVHQNLLDTLKLLYEKSTDGCQKNFESMLQQLYDVSDESRIIVLTALKNMEKCSLWYTKAQSLQALRKVLN